MKGKNEIFNKTIKSIAFLVLLMFFASFVLAQSANQIGLGDRQASQKDYSILNNQTNSSNLIVNGSVGIGTSNPLKKLHISSSGFLDGARIEADLPEIFIRDIFGSLITDAFIRNNIGLELGTFSSAPIKIITGSAERMRITSNGNVGIGTTNPDNSLVISSDKGTTAVLDSRNEALYVELMTRSNGTNKWSVGSLSDKNSALGNMFYIWQYTDKNDNPANAYRFVVSDNGNVGIGTANPQSKLHIGGTANVDGVTFPDGTLQKTAAKPDVGTICGFSSVGNTPILCKGLDPQFSCPEGYVRQSTFASTTIYMCVYQG